jgi:GAF domain-containing protein
VAHADAAAGEPADLPEDLRALLGDETDLVANCANAAALLWHRLPDLNWAGFYLLRGDTLVLGPFQGKPACTRIAPGRGVCGAAAARRATLNVPDVRAFPGHIACDSASRSELVVPLLRDGRLLGVLDLDSPLPARFDPATVALAEAVAHIVAGQSPAD